MPTGRLLVFSTLVSLCVALLAVWLFVLRPAANEAVTPIDASEFLSDGSEQLLTTAEVGKAAPVVELETFEGSTLASDSLYGKPTVINFWATYCVPCITEMPMIEAVHQQLGDEVNFVGINVGESAELATPFIEKTGVTFAQLLDPDMEALGSFGAIALPHTVVLDPDGTVVAEKSLELKSEAELLEMIEEAR